MIQLRIFFIALLLLGVSVSAYPIDPLDSIKLAGNQYLAEEEWDRALECYFDGLKIAEDEDSDLGRIWLFNNIGIAYREKGELSNALGYHLQSLELAQELNEKKEIAACSNNIGIVHYKAGRSEKAMEYFRFSLAMKEELYDTTGIKQTLNNVASVYLETYEYDSAKLYFNRSLMLEEQGGDQAQISATINNIGHLHLLIGELDIAEEYFKKALEKIRPLHNPQILASIYDNLGLVYYHRHDYHHSLNYFDSCLAIVQSTADYENEMNVSYHLSELYAAMERYMPAYEYYKKYESLSSQQFSENNRVIESEALFVKQQKEYEILQLEKEKETKRLQITILIAVLSFLLLSGSVLFMMYRLHQKNRLERSLAREQSLRFKAVLEAQELERKRIAGDLHDSIGQLLSVVKMSISDLDDTLDFNEQSQKKQMSNALQVLDDAINEVRSISHNLMPSALIRSGFVPAIREMVSRINKSHAMKMELEVHGFPDRLMENVEISLYRIIQEMANNIIKHSEATVAKISLSSKNNVLSIVVSDNGKGFSKNQIENSAGIGWKNILSRISALNAKIDFQNSLERGSEVLILLEAS